jgi:hypothetical protein
MLEAVLHLGECTKVGLRLLLRVKGPKKIRCISEFFQGDSQLVTLFGRKPAEITSELERRIVPLPQDSAVPASVSAHRAISGPSVGLVASA